MSSTTLADALPFNTLQEQPHALGCGCAYCDHQEREAIHLTEMWAGFGCSTCGGCGERDTGETCGLCGGRGYFHHSPLPP